MKNTKTYIEHTREVSSISKRCEETGKMEPVDFDKIRPGDFVHVVITFSLNAHTPKYLN